MILAVLTLALAPTGAPSFTSFEKGDKLVTVDAKGVDAAVERGVEILLEMQEHLTDEKAKNGAEWPYQGVHREGGQIPPGYRVGGTSIKLACWRAKQHSVSRERFRLRLPSPDCRCA